MRGVEEDREVPPAFGGEQEGRLECEEVGLIAAQLTVVVELYDRAVTEPLVRVEVERGQAGELPATLIARRFLRTQQAPPRCYRRRQREGGCKEPSGTW